MVTVNPEMIENFILGKIGILEEKTAAFFDLAAHLNKCGFKWANGESLDKNFIFRSEKHVLCTRKQDSMHVLHGTIDDVCYYYKDIEILRAEQFLSNYVEPDFSDLDKIIDIP